MKAMTEYFKEWSVFKTAVLARLKQSEDLLWLQNMTPPLSELFLSLFDLNLNHS